jgi:hypothetical protein
MIEYETKKSQFAGPRALVYEFAKKHRLGDDEAERIFLKLGAVATEEDFLAEAKLAAPIVSMSTDKVGKL